MNVGRWIAALPILAGVAPTFAFNEQPGVAAPLCHCADGQTRAALQRRHAAIPRALRAWDGRRTVHGIAVCRH